MVDTRAATSAGTADGNRDGGNEGQARGNSDGVMAGSRDGLAQGRDRCTQDMNRQYYDRGFADGSSQGDREGRGAGHEAGIADGSGRGNQAGAADGRSRADAQARNDSAAPGAARGMDQANQSDAGQRGQADGAPVGDRQAQDRANSYDYDRGHTDQRTAFQNDAVLNNDTFSQRAPVTSKSRLSLIDKVKHLAQAMNINLMGLVGVDKLTDGLNLSDAQVVNSADVSVNTGYPVPNPDNRYFDDSRRWPTQEEKAAYGVAYRKGYNDGFRSNYMTMFDRSYQPARAAADQAGCADAQRQDYRPVYNRGFQEGRDRAYKAAYDAEFASASDAAYRASFPPASAAAYSQAYPSLYNQYFEAARAQAYASRVNQIYQANYEQARQARYNQVYPGYAQAAYNRGKVDETADFQARPVRLLTADVLETIPNGVYEPGETLRLKINLRNFIGSVLKGSDVRLQLRSSDNGVVLAESDASLVRDLRSKSVTAVTDALEFRLLESAANRTVHMTLSVLYQGRNVGNQDIALRPQYIADIKLASDISLKEGMPTTVRISVRNQSDVTTDDGFKIGLIWDSSKVLVVNPEVTVGGLAPDQTRIVEFTVIGRTIDTSINAPIAVQALSQGRRIGLTDLSRSVPVLNDYRIELKNSLSALRGNGVVRAQYILKNVSSRFLFKGLQLKIRVLDAQGNVASGVQVIGPNPQYLQPVQRGASVDFVIPLVSQGLPSGGVLELEVQEDGQTVVIHQAAI